MNSEDKRSTQNAPHFFWGNQCEGWWLKKEGSFTVIEETMLPETAEVKHIHKLTEQFFYCLSGNLCIELDDTLHILSKNEGLTIYANQPHKVKNTSNKPTRFLVISCPNSHEDRIDLD